MGGIFQGITNAFGGLLGETDAQYAQKQAQNQANTQSAQQQKYAGLGANVYQGLQSQGQAQIGAQNQNYLTLLDRYGSIAGLGNPLSFGNQNNPAQSNVPGGRTPTPGTPGTNPQATQTDPSLNPYSLDGNQQAQLNQSMAQIAHSQQQAQSQFAQHLAQAGLGNDPRLLAVGNQQLQEHFTALQQDTETKFYEQVKADKLTALQQIISGISQYGQQGVQETEAAGTGYLGLASSAGNAALAQQSNALQASQSNDSAISGLLNLGGFAAGGGFGGAAKSTPPIVSPTSNLTGLLG